MNILVADSDVPVAHFIADLLRTQFHQVHVAAPDDAPATAMEEQSHLLILDADVSEPSGLGILQRVRCALPHMPILLLTGNLRVEDRVIAFDSGADDYLAKPFASLELAARVRALLRRSRLPFEPVLRARDIELDRVRRVVNRNGCEIDLTPKEFGLLEYLMLNAGQDVSRSSIIRNVWKLSANISTNVVDVYINYLRRKLETDSVGTLIQTVRGAGYRIVTQTVPLDS